MLRMQLVRQRGLYRVQLHVNKPVQAVWRQRPGLSSMYTFLEKNWAPKVKANWNFSQKYVSKKDGRTTVVRGCASTKPCQGDSCATNEFVASTYYCNRDLCNSSERLAKSALGLVTLVSFSLFIYLF